MEDISMSPIVAKPSVGELTHADEGSPAAGYLSCAARKGNPKEAASVRRVLTDVALRYSASQAVAQLAFA